MNWTLLAWICGLLMVTLAVEEAKEKAKEESYPVDRLLATVSTKTQLFFTTSTTTVPFTCATFSSAVCGRRRRFQRHTMEDFDENADDDPVELFSGQLDDDERKGRVVFTVLATTTSTFTVTSTSINSATTFSISYFCSAPNVVIPPGC